MTGIGRIFFIVTRVREWVAIYWPPAAGLVPRSGLAARRSRSCLNINEAPNSVVLQEDTALRAKRYALRADIVTLRESLLIERLRLQAPAFAERLSWTREAQTLSRAAGVFFYKSQFVLQLLPRDCSPPGVKKAKRLNFSLDNPLVMCYTIKQVNILQRL